MARNIQLNDPNVVRLLWTSGWDSTFRLLQIVIEEERPVLPIYIISDRASTPIEIKSMNEIKKLTFKLFPKTIDLILDTVFYYIHDIKQYPEITQKHRTLAKHSHLGSQYEWLSRFAKQHEINDLELSIHTDDRAYEFIKSFVVSREDENGLHYSLDPNVSEDNPVSLFKPFRYPMLEWSKVKMKEHALQIGTFKIMNKTWFCHSPRNGKPCGVCNPCKYTIKEGMEYRLPKSALIRYRLEPLNSKVRKVKGMAHKLYRIVKSRL